MDGIDFEFNTQTPGILNWIKERGADFVTVCTEDQKDAISALVSKKMRESHTVDELSRMIRPCIGLTEGDANANAKYYDNIVATMRKEHPRMKKESIRKKALEASQKYAERQHRARAMTIAQTESAFAYNRGADEGVRQAQSQGFLGTVKKKWSTSGDDGVCPLCNSLEGTEIGLDDDFSITGRLLFEGQHMLPPAHPRCACAVEYIEVSPPTFSEEQHMQVEEAGQDDGGYGEHYFENGVVDKDTYEEVSEMDGFVDMDVTDKRVREMVDSVYKYTSAGYTDILAAQSNFSGRFEEYAATMNEAQRKVAIQDVRNIEEFLGYADKHKGPVYRALGFDVGGEYDNGAYDSFKELYKKGGIVETDTITSWTSKKEYTEAIWDARTGIDEEAEYSVQVMIQMKDGKQGVDISNLAEMKSQKEVLFPKTKLKISDVKEEWIDGETLRITIDAEEVPPEWMGI